MDLYDDRPKKASCFRVRLTIAILATFCPIVCYISRQNLSMAIVSMVDNKLTPTTITNNNNNSLASSLEELDKSFERFELSNSRQLEDTSCPVEQIQDDSGQTLRRTIKSYGPKYKWEQSDKNTIFSAFFATYVLFQIPAARLAERFGAKWILAIAALGSSLLSFASPWAASVHVYALAFVRALMGICQTALYPACFTLYAKWLPPVERSLAIPILCVGAYIGSIIASSLTGYFSEQELFGWEWAFYTPGILCALWFFLWFWLGANEPREHRSISLEEMQYIESKMETSKINSGSSGKVEISWKKVFTSQSIWAMIAAFFASNWSFTVVLLLLPSYLNDILHISPFKNGLINSIIYGLFCISSPIVGSCSTMMVETRAFGLSRLNIRKLFQGIALIGQVVCFIALPLIGCDQFWVLAFLFLQIILFSFTNGGEVHIPTELSVDFSGTIYAIGNCVGSSTGFIAPMLHSLIVTNSHNHSQWDTFFFIAASICFIGAMIFLIFGKNQLQDFSKNLDESQLDICQFVAANATNASSKGASSFSLASATHIMATNNNSIPTRNNRTQFQTQTIQPRQQQQQQQQQQRHRQQTNNERPPMQIKSVATSRAAWMEAAIQQHDNSCQRGTVQKF